MKPTVSIITVSYNAGTEIAQTIASVLAQTSKDYEYIFIDGGSTDNTVEVIETLAETFQASGIRYHVISEPDRGIYDAMNKGVGCAEGQWILMLNAGDRLADERVLEDLFASAAYEETVIYGDTVIKENYGTAEYRRFCKALPIETIRKGMPFCHQSVFVRRSALCSYPFELKWRLVADYDLFARMYRDAITFRYVARTVSCYDYAGVSIHSASRTLEETAAVRKAMGWSRPGDGVRLLLEKCKMRLRQPVRKLLPKAYFSENRGWQISAQQEPKP